MRLKISVMVVIAETERLIIRTWILEEDAYQAFQIYSDPYVTHFLKTKVDSVEGGRNLLERWVTRATQLNNGTGWWAIVNKENGEVIGTVILLQLPDNESQLTQDYEVGWHLKKSAWGKGYATEAATVILDYGFNALKLPAIYAVIRPQNTASIRVAQRLGMTPLGLTTRYYGAGLEMFELEATRVLKTTGNAKVTT